MNLTVYEHELNHVLRELATYDTEAKFADTRHALRSMLEGKDLDEAARKGLEACLFGVLGHGVDNHEKPWFPEFFQSMKNALDYCNGIAKAMVYGAELEVVFADGSSHTIDMTETPREWNPRPSVLAMCRELNAA